MTAKTLGQLRKALREHRLEQNLSYDDLANAIGADRVSGPTVRRFIESETEPHETTIHAIESYVRREGVAS